MSSGVSCGESSGVGNSQISLENYEYLQKLEELQADIFTSELTDAQKSTLNKVMNTISQHLTEKDYAGVQRDLAGDPVPNGNGGFFDHIQEMKDSYKALTKAQRSLEGSLRNPSLGLVERTLLENTLKETKLHIDRINGMFKQYGGIDKWKKR